VRYLRRNALVALGNTGTLADLSLAGPFLASDDELLREQAEWAVSRIKERHLSCPTV
jgi:epoxyqueuosine reductase QueG